ncbi:hypothetical protein D083_3543 [Dickeya solani RNS 08.23.3.1.A]|nr:hypothetical protein D083_3543 [Dickeya solani RNS 08.23.3.1.A]
MALFFAEFKKTNVTVFIDAMPRAVWPAVSLRERSGTPETHYQWG